MMKAFRNRVFFEQRNVNVIEHVLRRWFDQFDILAYHRHKPEHKEPLNQVRKRISEAVHCDMVSLREEGRQEVNAYRHDSSNESTEKALESRSFGPVDAVEIGSSERDSKPSPYHAKENASVFKCVVNANSIVEVSVWTWFHDVENPFLFYSPICEVSVVVNNGKRQKP